VGSLRTVKIDVSITQCGAPADHSEIVSVVCRDPRVEADQGRSLEARKITRRYEIHGVARVGDKTTPIDISETSVQIVRPPGCLPDGSGSALSAKDTAMYRLSEAVGGIISGAASIQPGELAAAGKAAAEKGDLDRADHYYELTLVATEHGREVSEIRAAAESWFAQRYGSFSADEPEAHPYSNTRIGLAARYSLHPTSDCY
jgi:hypothetical protein